MAITASAEKRINAIIEKVVARYLQRAMKEPKKNSGNIFVMALLQKLEPLLHRVHGMKTSLGSVMEHIAEIILKETWGEKNVIRKQRVSVRLPKNVFATISGIENRLSHAMNKPSYAQEKKEIIAACDTPSPEFEEHTYEIDLQLIDEKRNHLYFLEMKGPDPNTTEIPGAKKRLYTLMAWAYLQKKYKDVDAWLAIYYNNKFPKPYMNSKMFGTFDNEGLIVHEAFWNFVGKDNVTYDQLIAIFHKYGATNQQRIWDGFSKLIAEETPTTQSTAANS